MRGSPHLALLRLATPHSRLLMIQSIGPVYTVFLIRGKEHYYVSDAMFRVLLDHCWITPPSKRDEDGSLLESSLTPEGLELAHKLEAQKSRYAQLALWEQVTSTPPVTLWETRVS